MDNLILYALNGDTGEPIWTMPIPASNGNIKPMIAVNDVVYYDYPSGLLAIEQNNGVRAPSLAKETKKNFFVQRQSTPNHTTLLQNYPNPFNPETWIPFQLAENALVTISIYNTEGCLIRTLRLGHRPAGIYVTKDKSAYWDGKDSSRQKVASNVYFYTLQVEHQRNPDGDGAGKFTATRRMVIMK